MPAGKWKKRKQDSAWKKRPFREDSRRRFDDALRANECCSMVDNTIVPVCDCVSRLPTASIRRRLQMCLAYLILWLFYGVKTRTWDQSSRSSWFRFQTTWSMLCLHNGVQKHVLLPTCSELRAWHWRAWELQILWWWCYPMRLLWLRHCLECYKNGILIAVVCVAHSAPQAGHSSVSKSPFEFEWSIDVWNGSLLHGIRCGNREQLLID